MPDAIASVEAQRGSRVTLFNIANLPKHDANVALYARLSQQSSSFDLVTRIDADMVITEPSLFQSVFQTFKRHEDIDHLIIGVDDFFSGRTIDGLHFWRGGVTWQEEPPDLFSDLGSTTSRRKVKWAPQHRPIVLHAYNSGRLECVRYGAHRALKFRVSQNAKRGQDLEAFVRFAAESADPRRLLALAAVEAALSDPIFGRRFIDRVDLLGDDDWNQLEIRTQSAPALLESTLALIRSIPTKPKKSKATTPSVVHHLATFFKQKRGAHRGSDDAVVHTLETLLA